MSTSTPGPTPDTETTPDFEVVDTPVEEANTTYIAHRKPDGTEKRMPMSEWADYAKDNDL